jgi:hypothetical protein
MNPLPDVYSLESKRLNLIDPSVIMRARLARRTLHDTLACSPAHSRLLAPLLGERTELPRRPAALKYSKALCKKTSSATNTIHKKNTHILELIRGQLEITRLVLGLTFEGRYVFRGSKRGRRVERGVFEDLRQNRLV